MTGIHLTGIMGTHGIHPTVKPAGTMNRGTMIGPRPSRGMIITVTLKTRPGQGTSRPGRLRAGRNRDIL
jgi:hypothetical protein